jgi:hypothetical protein
MNKLYTYGCSFTQGMWEFDNTESGTGLHKGLGFDREITYGSKDNWTKLLSKELNLEYINRGFEGSGVLYALHCMIKDLGNYENGDIVILQISYSNRKFSHLNHFNPPHSHKRHTDLIDRGGKNLGVRKHNDS